jgi:predicted permease
MRALRRLIRRLSSWTTTARDEERLRVEIEEHLALQAADNLRAGLSPVEARRQAALKFGAVESIKDSYREQRGLPSLEGLAQDTRHALRRLRMAPAFTVATILTLALGIGATTSIFTLVNAVLLKSLPVANPGELYRLGRENRCCYLSGYSQQNEFSLVSYDLYKYLRDNTTGFSELAAFSSNQLLFGVRPSGGSEAAQSYPGEFVSGNYFAMFGIRPYAGRMLTAADDEPGAPPVAVMSYRLFRGKYGAAASVIGSTFNFNDRPLTIVGITPPGFYGDTLRSTPPDFFLPLNTEPFLESDTDLAKYSTHWLELIGRIQPGAAPGPIEAQMRAGLRQWLRSHLSEMSANDRAVFSEQTLFLTAGGAGIASMRQQYRQWLLILMAGTGFVLLIVCANVANLMLVRGMERRRQISLSRALGARPSRVVRQPLIESLLLSLGGGVAGIAIAYASTRLILHYAFPSLPGSAGIPIEPSPSMPVLLFAFVTSLATGVAFGIAPAWMTARVDPVEALRGSSRTTTRAGTLPRRTFVVIQAALSLVLLSASGLLTAALQNLENQDLGFDQDRRLVATTNPRLAGYRPNQLSQLYARIHDAVAGLPGVSSVALCLYSPPGAGWGAGVWIDGHPAPGPGEDNSSAWNRVTAEYFGAIGSSVIEGRGFSEQDTPASRKVAVVSEAFARKFFGSEDPIGKHFGREPEDAREFEIVGVARDARYFTRGLGEPTGPLFFLPEAQAEYAQTNLGSLFLRDIVILRKPDADVTFASVYQAIASVDPRLPIASIRTLREQVSNQFTQQRLIARLSSLFGVLSLVLASIGLYGVTAYNAGRRTSEIGVRMALGASRRHVVLLILRGAFGLILLGLLIGVPLTLGLGRFLGSQLYGTNPYNPAVMLAAVAALGFSGLVACFVPAFRASLIPPLDALRRE